ncbi:MAG: threonine synthase [Treponema sp.]|jgi:threonine synthase|nr:threonine synthase [Treponema sp.]
MRNVKGAICVKCGAEFEAGNETCACTKCGGILEIAYDYNYIKTQIDCGKFAAGNDFSMWRYLDFLPIEEGSRLGPLRVGWSPLYKADTLGLALGLENLYVKDDGINPTSSLKDRASAIAVVRAFHAGKDTVACSSTGNAASSLVGAAASMGLKSVIFVPERVPQGKLIQLLIFGATVVSVKGDYGAAFRLSAQAIEKYGWYNRNAAVNPYLSEGKKTVALEIAEQLGIAANAKAPNAATQDYLAANCFITPDFIAISVGDGCTMAGIWKAFKDLYTVGLIDKLPRLISVQAEGCCPVNRAVERNAPIEPMEENTLADSIAVGIPRNGDKALAAIRESNGITVNVSDNEILAAMRLLGKTTGVFAEPAGAAGTAGLVKAAAHGLIPRDSLVVSIVTGNGLKDTASARTATGIDGGVTPNGNGESKLLNIKPDIDLLARELTKRGL